MEIHFERYGPCVRERVTVLDGVFVNGEPATIVEDEHYVFVEAFDAATGEVVATAESVMGDPDYDNWKAVARGVMDSLADQVAA